MAFISVLRSLLQLRKRLLSPVYTYIVKKQVASVKGDVTVGGFTRLNTNTELGHNVNFNGMRVYGRGRLTIGDNFHSGPDCVVLTQNHNHEGDALPYDDTYIVKDVTIGDNVWLGQGVTVLPGVTIGEGAIIQAGSVVAKDVPKCGIAGGHPATVFDSRDEERYERLKAAGKFM